VESFLLNCGDNDREAPKARNTLARGVAPGTTNNSTRALKVRNIIAGIAFFQSFTVIAYLPGATRLASLGACPWLSYSAPLALGSPKSSVLDKFRLR
jgi:hypothetical protein